jgi:hypothetical protein
VQSRAHAEDARGKEEVNMAIQVKVDRGMVWLVHESTKPSQPDFIRSLKPETAAQLAHQLQVAVAALTGQGLQS